LNVPTITESSVGIIDGYPKIQDLYSSDKVTKKPIIMVSF